MRRRRAGRASFTLIEILVVITIIAVLAAIIAPSVGRARRRGRQIQCASNLRQLHSAILNYATENSHYPPCHSWEDSDGNIHRAWVHWLGDDDTERVYEYREEDGESCIRRGVIWPYVNNQIKVYSCPTHTRGTPEAVRSYAMCSDMYGSGGDGEGQAPSGHVNFFLLPNKSSVILMADIGEDRLENEAVGSFFQSTNYVAADYMAYRHDGVANVIYVDGHVEQRR